MASLSPPLALAVALLLCAVVLAVWRPGSQARCALPYQRHKTLFTSPERRFLTALDAAVGKQYRVFGKTRIADVLGVSKEVQGAAWWNAFGQISQKHFDYLLCDPKSLRIIAAIELDDPTHDRPDRIERDIFVDQACLSAGLPLIRFKTRNSYSAALIARKIRKSL